MVKLKVEQIGKDKELPLAHHWKFWYNTLDGIMYASFILAGKILWHLIDYCSIYGAMYVICVSCRVIRTCILLQGGADTKAVVDTYHPSFGHTGSCFASDCSLLAFLA